MADQLNIILVPHTHWDREWYQTFQQFRIRLVHTVDKLLAILDRDANFSHFMLDGQTIVLDDYLEVQPEQEERLRGHIRAGRILVGPWYLQPDEFLVSGEALIRNLQIGLQRAAEFGEPMRVGYVPDCFGHIAQLPQILQGFGIDNAVFWRGVGSEAHKSEFCWSAPDGTEVLVIHLASSLGYSNARQMPLSPQEFATHTELLTTEILPKATTTTLLFMNGSDHLEPQDGLPSTIAAANNILAHISPEHEMLFTYLEQMAEQLAQGSENGQVEPIEGIRVRIGTLPQYVEAVRQQHGLTHNTPKSEGQKTVTPPLQVLSGEMRSSQYSHLLPSVLSTRMWIKQQNAATEHLLQHWMEPLTAWAWKLGAAYPTGLVRLAWKYLLQNHPHDSICGCSIDQVHRENAVRFAQSQQVAESVIAQALQNIVEHVNTHSPFPALTTQPYKPIPLVVFNPAPGVRAEAVQVVVQSASSLHHAVIVDEQGQHMPYAVVNRWRQELGSMAFARETLAMAVTLTDSQNTPGLLIQMAEDMIISSLGKPEKSFQITHLHIDTQQQPGVAHVEIMLAPRGQTTIHERELLHGEQQMVALFQREDIHTLEVTAIDQARATIDFVAADLPAFGFKTYWLYPAGLGKARPSTTTNTTLVCQERSIENEWYRIEASAEDGTLTVTDKQTGATFSGLNRFVDGGDVGDLYNYCPPMHDLLVSQPLDPPSIELVSAGPVHALLRISGRWSLPSACSASRAERSSRLTVCHIISEVRLTPGVRRVDIHTSVDNRVKDHRLRVLFPVPYTVENVAAEGTFEVRTRPVIANRPPDVAEWIEQPVNTFPQKRFVDISNSSIGLGVLNRGLPEYEILSDTSVVAPGQMAVALTLLRCVEWLSRGDLSTRRGHAGPMEHTPEAQCLGHHEFDYALVPHSGEWEAEENLVLREAQHFNISARVVVGAVASNVTEHQQMETGHDGEAGHDESRPYNDANPLRRGMIHHALLPSQATLIEVEPRSLVVSAIKRSYNGAGLIVRLYNPLPHAIEATVRPGVAMRQAFVANLQEEQQEQLFWSGEDGTPLNIGIRAGGITTILFH